MTRWIPFAICSLLSDAAPAAVIDSFDIGDHFLQTGVQSTSTVGYPGPIGNRRIIGIPTREVPPEASLTSTLDSGLGHIAFFVDTAGIPTRFPLDLTITYTGGGPDGTGPYSLLGHDAFVFSFSDVTGIGGLVVEFGSGSASYGPEVTRIPISGPGEVIFPFDKITHATNGDLDNFIHMHFVFEPVSDQFGFTLDGVSVVPEPASAGLVGMAAFVRSIRRRRTTKAEQAGAGQPATRPKSDSEGSDKPQPESEERSR